MIGSVDMITYPLNTLRLHSESPFLSGRLLFGPLLHEDLWLDDRHIWLSTRSGHSRLPVGLAPRQLRRGMHAVGSRGGRGRPRRGDRLPLPRSLVQRRPTYDEFQLVRCPPFLGPKLFFSAEVEYVNSTN